MYALQLVSRLINDPSLGGGVLKGVQADLLLTGEMSHVRSLNSERYNHPADLIQARGLGGSRSRPIGDPV